MERRKKAVSEIPVASSRPKDGLSMPQLCGSWKNSAILLGPSSKIGIHFGIPNKDNELRHQLQRKLFILAENSDLEDLDGLQRSVLEAFARGVDY